MAKICHITSVHKRDDIRIFIKECSSLIHARHEVILIVADDLPDEIKNGVYIYGVRKPINRKYRMIKTPIDIYNKIIQLNPEFVHFHDPELIFIGHKLAKLGYKIVYDVHEDLPKQVLSKYYLPRFIRRPISFLVLIAEKYYAKQFYGIIAATTIISKRFKLYNDNTITLCNYPILAELNIANTNWEDRQDSMCYIGSISKTRGIVPVVTASALSNIKLELAGIFSGDISHAQLNQLGENIYLNYLGVLGRDGIIDLLKKVKIGIVTLLPTPSYTESLPIKMFEYMLAGIPIIASNFPFWQEIVRKYDCGVLVNPENASEIASVAKYLLTHQDEAKQMGQNGRNAVLSYFNWEQEQQKLINFYQ